MIGAEAESARTLASVFGIDEQEALALLDIEIAVTHDGSSPGEKVALHLIRLLKRTVGRTSGHGSPAAAPAVEVLIGAALPRTPAVGVRVLQADGTIEIGRNATGSRLDELPEPGAVLVACYAAAAAVRIGVGSAFRLPFNDPVRLSVADFALPRSPIPIGKAYLAGAGAVGHGFLYGLVGTQVTGELHVVDPKVVASGNLNRCLWLSPNDVGSHKAEALVSHAAPLLPALHLNPRVADLSRLPERTEGPWLQRLVVGVDSRRARRRLQQELPRDVFDASTTGIEEVVLHFNSRLDPLCMGCVYHEDQAEHAHERHVAEVLGVTVEEVRQQFISASAVAKIGARYPQLRQEEIEGRAYDSLFKALCGAGQIGVEEGRTVLAPLAFVSVLAGVALAMEFVRRCASGRISEPFSTWRLSPWASPVPDLRNRISRRAECTCCGRSEVRQAVNELWHP